MFHVVSDRELRGCSERHVRKAISSNVQVLQRMCLQRTLTGHSGCVNTCSFDTEDGNILITGSDDQQIILWDWERGGMRLKFDSGHLNNVFQARMLPRTGGTRIVTCAADGQVHLAELPEGASSVTVAKSVLAAHEGRAHKLALDPLHPQHCFYSSGEDGQVIHFDLRCGTGARQHSGSSSSRSGARRKLLVCRGYSRARGPTARVVGLNAIHVNPSRPWQFAVGGDDLWARVYDIRKIRDLSNPSLESSISSSSSSSSSSLAAVAAAAAAAAGFRSSTSSAAAAAAEAAAVAIGPPTRQAARDSRVYAMADEPVARLCAEGLSREGGRGFMGSMSPSITCVMFSRQGELLASYNDEDIYLFSPQASAGSLGSSSSSGYTSSTAGAAEQGDHDRPGSSRQQQQQADSPLRRSRAAAAAADSGNGDRQQQPEQQQKQKQERQQQHQEQQQQQRYYEDEDAERPRWRRRLKVIADSTAAAAADPAAAGDGIETGAEGVAMDLSETAQRPATATATAVDNTSSAAAAAAATAAAATTSPAAADRGVNSPIGAVVDTDNNEVQRGSSSSSSQQRQQQQGSAGPPACGLGRGFGTPAARFYNLESSNRDGVVASYYGHRNSATVKGVSFFGDDDEYVMSGSDCGHIYVWSKQGGEIVWWQSGDDEVVNCLEPHPHKPHVLATSGIEHTVKVWAPTAAKPSPPSPAALRSTMAANKRDREAQREAMTEPEQWLLQLLAAQRRRAAAAERMRRAQAGAAAAATNTAPATANTTTAADGDQPQMAQDDDNHDDGVDDAMTDADAEGVVDEDGGDDGVFARFVLPGGGRVVQVRFGTEGRSRRGATGATVAQNDEDELENGDEEYSSDAEAGEEDSEGDRGEGNDRPCYVS